MKKIEERLAWHTIKEWEEIGKDPNVEKITYYHGIMRLKPKAELK